MSGNENRLAFRQNKSSLNARKVTIIRHNMVFELWFDKHYDNRFEQGDKNGRREGIEPTIVESLVTRSLEHLVFYSAATKGFGFVNYENYSGFETRVILQEEKNGSVLNVVIEVHYLSINRLEVTVITAMVCDNFRMVNEQYCIKIHQESSFLRKLQNGKVLEICSF